MVGLLCGKVSTMARREEQWNGGDEKLTEPKLPLRRQKKLDGENIEVRWTTAHPFLPFLILEGLVSDYPLGQYEP